MMMKNVASKSNLALVGSSSYQKNIGAELIVPTMSTLLSGSGASLEIPQCYVLYFPWP